MIDIQRGALPRQPALLATFSQSMKKALIVLLLLVNSALAAWGQGVCHSDVVLRAKTPGGAIFPASFTRIAVCTDQSCGTLVQPLYSDASLTQTETNPFNADINGNYTWCTAPGNFVERRTYSGTTIQFNGISLGSGPGSFTNSFGSGYQDVLEINTPTPPGSGIDRLYLNLSTHQLACINSSSNNCLPSGSGSVGPGTSGFIPSFATSTTVGNSHVDDGITTASTIHASENIETTGSMTTGTVGSNAGLDALGGNVSNPALPSNAAGFLGPNSASFTSYFGQLPSIAPAGSLMLWGTPSSNVSALSFVGSGLTGVQGSGAKVQLSTGSTTSGDCVKFDANGNTVDAGAVCGSGSGGTSSGTNTVQVSNGSGGFISNTKIQEDTTNGYLGNNNPAGLPIYPLDVEWTALNRSTAPGALFTLNGGYTATPASPPDIHVNNGTLNLSGTDSAFTDGTNSVLYYTMTDSRTPSGASTVGHQLAIVGRETFSPGINLTCTNCFAFYGTAGFGGTGTASNLGVYDADIVTMSGTGTISNYLAFSAGLPTVATGTGPKLNNITGFAAGDPAVPQHGTGSGCVASFAVGSGVCSVSSGAFAYFEDATAPSALKGGLSVGKGTAPVQKLDVEGGVQIGSTTGSHSDITLTSLGNGTVAVTLKMPNAGSGIVHEWPGDSATFVGTTNHNDATGQTANYGPITLYNAGDTVARFFRVTIYTVCSTSVAASTVTVSVSYTDDVQAQTDSGAALSCATAGTHQSFVDSFFVGSGGHNVTFSATVANAPHFNIHVIVEEINPSTNGT